MTTRQKKGVGFFISAALFAIAGTVFCFIDSTPDWLSILIQCVTAVTTVIGIVITTPTLSSSSSSMIFTAYLMSLPGVNGPGRRHKKF